MSTIRSVLDDARLAILKVLPGLTVLLAVLVLLRGFSGTAEAVKLQVATLTTSFLGAGDSLGAVLIHTLPLAIAAAIATFAITGRTLKFQSLGSFVALACIILIGASIGGFLRGLVAEQPPSHTAGLVNTATANRTVNAQNLGIDSTSNVVRIGVTSDNPLLTSRPPLRGSIEKPQMKAIPCLSAVDKSPLEQLSTIDWLAEPDLAKVPPRRIEPLHVLPAVGGAPGAVFRAINQVLGYLVAYQPRLFLAAIIAGSWFGWTWHRRLTQFYERVVEESNGDHDHFELRRAA